jgi:hypothetical protein
VRTLPSFLVTGIARLSGTGCYFGFPPASTMTTSTKLRIPHSQEDLDLVGVLEQLTPEQPTHGRKIALV